MGRPVFLTRTASQPMEEGFQAVWAADTAQAAMEELAADTISFFCKLRCPPSRSCLSPPFPDDSEEEER